MSVDTSGLEQALTARSVELCNALGDAFVAAAQSRCSRRSGALAESIAHDDATETGAGAACTITVGEEYGIYQDEGTGVYGPDGAPITGNPLLAFDWPAAGGLVIVHSVQGAPGTHFWTDTVAEWGSIVGSL